MSESTYDVVLLVEQTLSALDAEQVRSLHTEIEAEVRYHLLLPVENAAEQIETAMGTLASGDLMATAMPVLDSEEVEEMQQDLLDSAREAVAESVRQLEAAGAVAEGSVVSVEPVDALVSAVQETDAAEAIILTRPHLVAEFFHLDWTSRARRKLGVPLLHLLERETFDEQAGQGEGITGL
ncbi:MAG: hypothetical protein QM655_12035 [Nocardioidaceae bacterium]